MRQSYRAFPQEYTSTGLHLEVYITLAVFLPFANESFFSHVNRMDKEGGVSYPKAVNVPKVIGKVVTVNYFKHKRDKLVNILH